MSIQIAASNFGNQLLLKTAFGRHWEYYESTEIFFFDKLKFMTDSKARSEAGSLLQIPTAPRSLQCIIMYILPHVLQSKLRAIFLFYQNRYVIQFSKKTYSIRLSVVSQLTNLLSLVKDVGDGCCHTQQDLQDLGKVCIDEMTDVLQHDFQTVQDTMLPPHRKNFRHIQVLNCLDDSRTAIP